MRGCSLRLWPTSFCLLELVDRAEERGLVRRRRAEEDRREVYIDLTDDGEKVLRELSLHSRTELLGRGPALVKALKGLLEASRHSQEDKDNSGNVQEGE